MKRERDRIEAVERTYHEAMMKLEADIEESLEEKEGLLAELDDKDQEVNQVHTSLYILHVNSLVVL